MKPLLQIFVPLTVIAFFLGLSVGSWLEKEPYPQGYALHVDKVPLPRTLANCRADGWCMEIIVDDPQAAKEFEEQMERNQ